MYFEETCRMVMWYCIIGSIFQVLSFVAVLVLCVKYTRLRKKVLNEHYTDYVNGNLTFRVFKIELEYHAVKDLNPSKILDEGDLSVNYRWILFER